MCEMTIAYAYAVALVSRIDNFVGLIFQVSLAKEPYTQDIILQKRPILSILLTVATP